jgi:hypothetical protein
MSRRSAAPKVTRRAVGGTESSHFGRDYGELVFARAVAAPPSIVYVRQQPRRAEEPARDVLALLDRPEFALGHLVVMSDRRMRRRALPA